MTGLTEDINSQEEAIEYARSDPNKALGIAIWNIIKLKEHCSCRLASCRTDQKKGRLKNAVMQFGGGIVGGSITASLIWAWVRENVLSMVGKQ